MNYYLRLRNPLDIPLYHYLSLRPPLVAAIFALCSSPTTILKQPKSPFSPHPHSPTYKPLTAKARSGHHELPPATRVGIYHSRSSLVWVVCVLNQPNQGYYTLVVGDAHYKFGGATKSIPRLHLNDCLLVPLLRYYRS